MKKSSFSNSNEDVLAAKLATVEAKNHHLNEQVSTLEKNITVLNQTIVHLTGHQVSEYITKYLRLQGSKRKRFEKVFNVNFEKRQTDEGPPPKT